MKVVNPRPFLFGKARQKARKRAKIDLQGARQGKVVSKGLLPRPGSKLEALFEAQCKALGLPVMIREFLFHDVRKWRFDFVFPGMIAVELEGLVQPWKKSRHTTNSGFEGDCFKYNAATLQGYRVGRFTASMVKSGAAVRWVEDMLQINKKL